MTVSLRDPVAEICERLGLPYDCTAQIKIEPAKVEAIVYLERDGKKYINPETNAPACETRTFEVLT